MPKKAYLKKVMVIGSGPIIIGQAAEFDYAGSQACRALKEEGLEVVLVNSNPATIMTDTHIADRVYIEPLTVDFLEEIVSKERPEGLLATLGGQAGVNLAVQLAEKGILGKYGVELLGTSLTAIKKAEDRELFKETMQKLGEPVPESTIVEDVAAAVRFAETIGYPIIVRPAYTMGGTGGGIAENEEELIEIVIKGLKYSMIGQVLIERSVAGWKEIEYEVMRDGNDNCITICNMENVDPVGVHTGDSIVVAPTQTLTDREAQMLRTASLRIIRELGIEGGCNAQYALDPNSESYYVIEVNPRSSRTVPFLSKITDIKMVNVATRVALGETLKEQGFKSGLVTPRPYVAVKAPVFSFSKMQDVDISLGPEMKSTGEVMGIDYHYARALYKAITGMGMNVPTQGKILFTVADKDKEEMKQLAKAFSELGFQLVATEGTAKTIRSLGIDADIVGKVHERSTDIIQMIKSGQIHMVINTLTQGKHSAKDGFKIRRATVEHGIACLTSLDTAWEVLRVLSFMRERRLVYVLALQDYVGGGDGLA